MAPGTASVSCKVVRRAMCSSFLCLFVRNAWFTYIKYCQLLHSAYTNSHKMFEETTFKLTNLTIQINQRPRHRWASGQLHFKRKIAIVVVWIAYFAQLDYIRIRAILELKQFLLIIIRVRCWLVSVWNWSRVAVARARLCVCSLLSEATPHRSVF